MTDEFSETDIREGDVVEIRLSPDLHNTTWKVKIINDYDGTALIARLDEFGRECGQEIWFDIKSLKILVSETP